MSENICLATNYVLMTESARKMWIDLDRHLEEFGTRLVLLNTATLDAPLPFPVIQIPFLLRDYAGHFPHASVRGGSFSAADLDLLQSDCSRGLKLYAPHDAVPGLLGCRRMVARLLETLQPGHVLTWDSTSPLARIIRMQCEEAGVPVQAIERGLLPETLMTDSRGMQGYSDFRTHWLAQDLPASASDPAAYERIRSYYLQRKPLKYEQPEFGGGGAGLREKLEIGNKKVVVFFGNYDCCGLTPEDGIRRRYHSPVFSSTNDALLQLWSLLEKNPGATLVFKPHPIDRDPYAIAKVQGVRIVRDANIHALIELADVVAAQFTTLQFEAALYDKPILLLGQSAWWGRDATYEVTRRDALGSTLKAALDKRDWPRRSANARAFLTWAMDQSLIACNSEVPARRTLRDFARFITKTSLDDAGLPTREERWDRAQEALTELKTGQKPANANGLFLRSSISIPDEPPAPSRQPRGTLDVSPIPPRHAAKALAQPEILQFQNATL